MTCREIHYIWEWNLESGPEVLWPPVADPNRFNHDTGIPSIDEKRDNTRVEKQADDGDVIISQEVPDDPEVCAWLKGANNSLTVEESNRR